ncbi:MAG: LysR family transcriptional regulator, partial [Myxococcota bacterium]
MEWSDLPLFLEVARTGSFTAAARALGTTQSTVSRRIAALEGELGTSLFRRERHGVGLSTAAAELLPLFESAETAVHEVVRRASGLRETVRGTVRIATVEELSTWLFAPALPRLRDRWPELRVELSASNALANLAGGEADLAVRLLPPDRADLRGRRLGAIPIALFGHADPATPWAELDWLEPDDALALSLERRWLAHHVPNRRTVLRASSSATLAQAAAAGLGVA